MLSIIDLEIAIFGNNQDLINVLPPFIFALLFLTIVVGFAYDIQRTPLTTLDAGAIIDKKVGSEIDEPRN